MSQQTIIRCFDNGSLKGFRVPGSRFRRIPRPFLFAFMREHGIPIEGVDALSINVLAVTANEAISAQLTDAMTQKQSFALTLSGDPFTAGVQAKSSIPDAMIIDCSSGILEAAQMLGVLQKDPDFGKTLFFGLSPGKLCPSCEAPKGLEVFEKPFDAKLLAERIRSLVGERKELE